MIRISKTFTFEAGHRLMRHDGKCRRLHGHSYRVDVSIEGNVQENHPLVVGVETGFEVGDNPQTGMVLDFSKLKEWWVTFEAGVDHFLLLEAGDPAIRRLLGEALVVVDFAPTAENIAQWILSDLQNWLLTQWPDGFPTPRVRVWETPTSWAEA